MIKMGTIIWPALAGVLIGYAFSGVRKLARIRRMKNELEIVKEQNAAANYERLKQLDLYETERDKNRSIRKDLILWESLAEVIANHPAPFLSEKLTIPEKADQLLAYYHTKHEYSQKQLSSAAFMLRASVKPEDFPQYELQTLDPKIKKWLEIYDERKTIQS